MLRSSDLSLPSRLSNQNVLYILVSPMRSTCNTHLILLDLTTLIYGEAYKL
jgi:hypothetical protein